MAEMIPGLRGTVTHRLSVTVYQHHHDGGRGACVMCGRAMPCLARRHAATVIVAAGEVPNWYDPPVTARETSAGISARAGPEYPSDVVVIDEVAGFAVGGRSRREHPDGFTYERDDP